ncbi:ParB N-terminal domain-containing protein [Acaryochloris marina NIES-2412]
MPSPTSPSESPGSSIQLVEIAKIRMDGGTQPRSRLYEEVVADYADDMQQGAKFPPVVIYYDGEEYWLADGFHRVRAKEAIGSKEIAAEVIPGQLRDAILHSVGANSSHGLRRTNADKYRAVERLLRDRDWRRWSNREISRRCGVSHVFVSQVRNAMYPPGNDYQADDGEKDSQSSLDDGSSPKRLVRIGENVITMDTSNIGRTSQKSAKSTKRKRTKKKPAPLDSQVAQSNKVKKGDIWKLGKSHFLFCGDSESAEFQKLLPSEIALLLFFPREAKPWLPEQPANIQNTLLFHTSYGEDIDFKNLRQIVENCISTTTEADEPVVIINLPDPSLFILLEDLYCPCYCAEPDPHRCSDALTAWSITNQPSKKL